MTPRIVRPAVSKNRSREALEHARHLLALYRARAKLFGEDLFVDPAWMMMLDLFVAYRTGRVVSVSSLCLASSAPPTTALRWINMMVERKIICRTPDANDLRRHNVTLSEQTREWMEDLLYKTPL
jgi:DNA-binding MarR family transcriptional regulator